MAEYRGYTSVDGVICPHCRSRCRCGTPPGAWIWPWLCRDCGESFVVKIVATPLGLAWQSWDRDPAVAAAAGRNGGR